eukprot:Pompholyxophrys_punicea_v1_NODE_215_length_2724_cov_21.246534.p2 type:complete len:116 gc:universal NODE_215_length_2724_cov_21.246534:1381-1034(-)
MFELFSFTGVTFKFFSGEVSTSAAVTLFIPPHSPESVDNENLRAFLEIENLQDRLKTDPSNEERIKRLSFCVGISSERFKFKGQMPHFLNPLLMFFSLCADIHASAIKPTKFRQN